jgi:hypothetical protein
MVAALALTLASVPADARGHGRFHFSHRHIQPFSAYGATVAAPSYVPQPMVTSVTPVVVLPPRALSCQHSEQIVTVPAEGGGTRDIRVTRC